MSRPVLFVTNHAPPERVPAFRLLAEREEVVFALIGGRLRHAGASVDELPFAHLRVREREIGALAASGRYRAVVAGLSGRVALPSAFLGARRARVPFVLWATIWAHPRTPAHALSWAPLRLLYRNADAVVTYGPHVSAYVRARGARRVFEAPQAVDNAFWSASVPGERRAPFQAVFVGRMEREKGVTVLFRAWRESGLQAPYAALALLGGGRIRAPAAATSAVPLGPLGPEQVRNFMAGSDVLVLPSLATRAFREPWGLVVNEAMNQSLPVIASTAVGAVAGGLVRHEHNGLVVAPGDVGALAAALRRMQAEPGLRARLGRAGRADVARLTFAAWAEGVSRALGAAGASRSGC